MALNGMLDDSPMIPYMRANLAPAVALSIIQLGAVVALLAVVVGGLPLAFTVIRRARSVDRINRGLLLVPAYSLLALVLYFGFIFLVATGRINIPGVVQVVQPGNFPIGNRLMLAGLMLIFVLGAIASTVAVWKVLSRTDVEQDTFKAGGRTLSIDVYKFAYIPAVITAVCMLVMLVATLVWSWLVFSAMPEVLAGQYGLWQTSTQAWLYGIIAVMAICCLTAILGVTRGRTAMAQA